jgi:hypothetical protein
MSRRGRDFEKLTSDLAATGGLDRSTVSRRHVKVARSCAQCVSGSDIDVHLRQIRCEGKRFPS